MRTRSQWLSAAIEGGRGGEGVAKRVLLVKVGGAVFVADDDPLFVDDEGDLFGGVEAVHDRGVALYDLVHPQGVFQGVEVLIYRKVGGIQFAECAGSFSQERQPLVDFANAAKCGVPFFFRAQAQPLAVTCLFGMAGCGERLQHQLVAVDPADVFGWAGAGPLEAEGRGQVLVRYLLEDESVGPIVAKVVDIGIGLAFFAEYAAHRCLFCVDGGLVRIDVGPREAV